MKLITRSAIAAAALLAPVSMASAASLVSGQTGVIFDSFDLSTQGTQLAAETVTGCSGPSVATFCGIMRAAVYKNTSGTLDFYYQFTRTDDGKPDSIERITAGSFTGYTTDAYVYTGDVDGAGTTFVLDTNGTPEATARRVDGTVSANFSIDNLVSGGESSATFIFRTNATNYTAGTFGTIDNQTFSGSAYQPTAAVPEPASWAMMVGGFGLLGGALRRKRNVAVSFG